MSKPLGYLYGKTISADMTKEELLEVIEWLVSDINYYKPKCFELINKLANESKTVVISER